MLFFVFFFARGGEVDDVRDLLMSDHSLLDTVVIWIFSGPLCRRDALSPMSQRRRLHHVTSFPSLCSSCSSIWSSSQNIKHLAWWRHDRHKVQGAIRPCVGVLQVAWEGASPNIYFYLAKIGLTSRYLPLNHNGKCCPKYNAILDASTNTIPDSDSDLNKR